MSDDTEPTPRRRIFLKQVATATGSIPLAPVLAAAAGVGVPLAASAADAAPAAPAADPVHGYTSFSQDEAAFVETMVNIMCPADGMTPNGVDTGLPIYIDRQLAGPFGQGARRYMKGPWAEGKPQLGYQLPMTPEAYFKAGIAAANAACAARFDGKPFDQITPAQAEAFLKDLGDGKVTDPRVPLPAWFNELVYPLFAQACFADPIYGGNYGKVFWKMIGYPGLPATHTIDMVQYRGKPYPGSANPMSIADFS